MINAQSTLAIIASPTHFSFVFLPFIFIILKLLLLHWFDSGFWPEKRAQLPCPRSDTPASYAVMDQH